MTLKHADLPAAAGSISLLKDVLEMEIPLTTPTSRIPVIPAIGRFRLMYRGLLRLASAAGVRWYHANPNHRTQQLRLRQIPREDADAYEERDPDEILRPEWVLYTLDGVATRTGLPVNTFPVNDLSAWALVVERMERCLSCPPDRVIQITPMRDFYDWLRNRPFHVTKEFLHQALANHFREHPTRLTALFAESCLAFRPYANCAEPFIPESRDDERFLADPSFGGNAVLRALLENEGEWRLTHNGFNLDFKVVDREVGPRRSSKKTGPWYYDDGSPASDADGGGMDLLMVSQGAALAPLPIVGEVKVRRDQTPFLGLIQAFTYAAELCTANQFGRLARWYPGTFHGLPQQPMLDVYLISLEPAPDHEPILRTTMELAAAMYEADHHFHNVVRRIAFLEARLVGDIAELACHGVFGHN
jgi:hypothetical protein